MLTRILTKGKLVKLFTIMLLGVILFGCKEEKEIAKSLEQIRQEEGLPVKVKVIEQEVFSKDLTFFAKLSGIQEATRTALVKDQVARIKAKVGQNVSENQVIVEFPTSNPTLQFTQAQLAYENSKKTYERMLELFKAGETSQQNLDNVQTQYEVNRRNYESLKQLVFIDAQFSGVITQIHVKEGEFVDFGKELFTVAKLNKMIAKIWVSDVEIRHVKQGMKATITVDDKKYVGTVSMISLSMDQHMRAFSVEISFDNPRMELRSGVTVDVKINTYTNPEAIVIPRNLINNSGPNKTVFIEVNGIAKAVEVVIGEESGLYVEILSGLKPGDKLITEGQALVEDGQKLKVIQ